MRGASTGTCGLSIGGVPVRRRSLFSREGGKDMPVRGATKKQNRQYEHIKESAKRRGRSTKRAKEIAARTVNKSKSKRKGGGRSKSRSRR
jgi:hypothetical protein